MPVWPDVLPSGQGRRVLVSRPGSGWGRLVRELRLELGLERRVLVSRPESGQGRRVLVLRPGTEADP